MNRKIEKEGLIVSKIKTLFALHIMFMIYSVSGICSKLAGQYPFLSLEFCFFYGIVILWLGFYAIGWQQMIKRLPLTVAFANKAVTVVWGLVWSVLFFDEAVTWTKLLGVVCVVIGIVIFVTADQEKLRSDKK